MIASNRLVDGLAAIDLAKFGVRELFVRLGVDSDGVIVQCVEENSASVEYQAPTDDVAASNTGAPILTAQKLPVLKS